MSKKRVRLKPDEAEYLGFKAKSKEPSGKNARYFITREQNEKLNSYRLDKSFKIIGKSTLKDKDGNLVMEWTKTSLDKEKQLENLKEVLNGLKDDLIPAEPVNQSCYLKKPDLCNQYTITDYHLGMMAWSEESGADWDLKIAEDMIVEWFRVAIDISPRADKAIFAQIGDFLHWDGLEALTPTSKNILDADTRYTKLVRTSIKVFRRIIQMLLQKYSTVHVIMAEGNHDLASSVWLRETFNEFYSNEPRLTFDVNPDPYYCFVWGDVTLFYHHGHKRNLSNIETVLISKFKKEFGGSEYVYAHTGHRHHVEIKETNTMKIEQHSTLASKDSHASRGGYLSKREAKVITYSREHGEVGRITLKPEMLKSYLE